MLVGSLVRLVKLHYYGYEFQAINDWSLHLVAISRRFNCQISLINFYSSIYLLKQINLSHTVGRKMS